MPAAGSLTEVCTIYEPRPDATRLPSGKIDYTDDSNWQVKADIRCQVESLNGTERGISDTVRGEVTHRLTTHFNPYVQITPADRVTWQDGPFLRRLEIVSAIPAGRTRRTDLVLLCIEKV